MRCIRAILWTSAICPIITVRMLHRNISKAIFAYSSKYKTSKRRKKWPLFLIETKFRSRIHFAWYRKDEEIFAISVQWERSKEEGKTLLSQLSSFSLSLYFTYVVQYPKLFWCDNTLFKGAIPHRTFCLHWLRPKLFSDAYSRVKTDGEPFSFCPERKRTTKRRNVNYQSNFPLPAGPRERGQSPARRETAHSSTHSWCQ